MRKLFLAISVGFMALGSVSCNMSGSSYEPLPQEVTLFTETRLAHTIFADLANQALELTKLQVDNPSGTNFPSGVNVTPTTENDVLTKLKLDYTEYNGRTGTVEISFTGTPLADGSTMTIEPKSYSVSGIKVSGAVSVTIQPKGAKKSVVSLLIPRGTLVDSYNNTITFSCEYTRVQDEGSDATKKEDDTFTYTGRYGGTYSNKISYSTTIVEPVVYAYGTGYAKAGKISQLPSTYTEPFTIEFGKGSYLNEILFTYQNISKLYKS